MCLFPLSIRNPTKIVHNGGGQLLKMQVPCGHCAQCLQAKRNEWYIRTHYEIERTYSKGGYVYFDTLTYNDANLPKLSHFIDIEKYGITDFSCFNHEHFKLFLKRLRRRITHHYGIKKDAFRYFLTTEYGEDDRFTHRPHHHILFFVYAPILPLKFSQLVSDCWQYGRTDGYPYKPSSYIAEHTYKKGTDFKTTTQVALYVSKYITKSSSFTKTLNQRISLIKAKFLEKSTQLKPSLTDEQEDILKSLTRTINMFHRQSQGFGLSYIDNLTPEKLMFIDSDQIVMKDSNKISKTYPLPMYYKRKLFYIQKKHSDGSRYWELSNKGVDHTLRAKLARIDSITLKYMDILRNCSNDYLKNEFFKLLDDRDISDYVVYEQFYKGRHRHIDSIDYKTKTQKPLNYEEENLNDWLQFLADSACPYNNTDCVIQVNEDKILRCPSINKKQVEQLQVQAYRSGHSHMIAYTHGEHIDNYYLDFTFNESSDYKFRNFDKIALLIIMMTEQQRDKEQITFEFLEDLKSKFKTIFKN